MTDPKQVPCDSCRNLVHYNTTRPCYYCGGNICWECIDHDNIGNATCPQCYHIEMDEDDYILP